jgi:hypothetical protein
VSFFRKVSVLKRKKIVSLWGRRELRSFVVFPREGTEERNM